MNNVITIVLCASLFSYALADDLLNDYKKNIEKIEHDSYQSIDVIFTRITNAIALKQKMSDSEWAEYLKVDELMNLIADSCIHSFDKNIANEIEGKIDLYLEKKIRSDLQLIASCDVDVDGIQQFLATAKMVCELSSSRLDCKRLIGVIKNENRGIINNLKQQKEIQQKEAFLARENMLLAGDKKY